MKRRGWQNLWIIIFWGLLFIYAHSEGDRFPTLIFWFFSLIFVIEFMIFLLIIRLIHAEVKVSEEIVRSDAPVYIHIRLYFPRWIPGKLKGCLKLPWNSSLGEKYDFDISLGAQSTSEQRLKLVFDFRGCYELGPLELTIQDPLALFTHTLRVMDPCKIWVTPRLLDINKNTKDIANGSLHSKAKSALMGEIDIPSREYRIGDPWQRIHWKTSARSRTLMVRELEEQKDDVKLIWLDLSSYSYRNEPGALEYAVSLTASFVEHAKQKGLPLHLVLSDRRHLQFSLPGADSIELQKTLAEIKASGRETADQVEHSLPAQDLILITGQPSEFLFEKLQSRTLRGSRIIVYLMGNNRHQYNDLREPLIPSKGHLDIRRVAYETL